MYNEVSLFIDRSTNVYGITAAPSWTTAFSSSHQRSFARCSVWPASWAAAGGAPGSRLAPFPPMSQKYPRSAPRPPAKAPLCTCWFHSGRFADHARTCPSDDSCLPQIPGPAYQYCINIDLPLLHQLPTTSELRPPHISTGKKKFYPRNMQLPTHQVMVNVIPAISKWNAFR